MACNTSHTPVTAPGFFLSSKTWSFEAFFGRFDPSGAMTPPPVGRRGDFHPIKAHSRRHSIVGKPDTQSHARSARLDVGEGAQLRDVDGHALLLTSRCDAHRAHWRRRGAPTRRLHPIKAHSRRHGIVGKPDRQSHARSARLDARERGPSCATSSKTTFWTKNPRGCHGSAHKRDYLENLMHN